MARLTGVKPLWPWLLVCLLATSCGGVGEDALDDGPPPDVLLISLDTLRADRLGCYGYERETSPQLDAIAATRSCDIYRDSPSRES